MKNYISNRSLLIGAGAGILISSFTLISWIGDPGKGSYEMDQKHDTIPVKEKIRYEKDLDKELRQLDDARKQLEEFKTKDWEKMQKDLQQAMKNIDIERIAMEAQQAISKIDMDKITKEVQTSLNKIDFDKIQRELESVEIDVPQTDKEKIKEELERAWKSVDEQMKKGTWQREIEEVKNIDMKQINSEVEEAKKEIAKKNDELRTGKFDMNETMTKAYADIDKAREELKRYQDMISSLEKDGLLNTREDYTIEYRGGELTINGKMQSKEVTNKYKKYFRKEKLTIKKQNGDINIDND